MVTKIRKKWPELAVNGDRKDFKSDASTYSATEAKYIKTKLSSS